MRRLARRIQAVRNANLRLPVSPRYVGLFWMSILSVMMGIAYSPISNVPTRLPLGLDILTVLLPAATDHWNPIWLYGVLWLTVGVAGILQILRRKTGEVVFSAMVSLLAMWCLAYAAAYVLGDPRAWVSAGIFLVFTGVTFSLTRVEPPLRFVWRRVMWTRS